MADIETDEHKALRLKFERLCDEQERLYKPEFEEVFKRLSKLDGGQWMKFLTEPTNFADELPGISLNYINQALLEAGFAADKEFCKDFTRYNEVFTEGKMIQQQGIILNLQEVSEQQEPVIEQECWQFYPVSIIASPELHTAINETVVNNATEGKGLFENITIAQEENESDDEYFDCEAYGVKCSLQPYVRELECYGITKSLFSSNGLSFSYALPVLKGIIDFIKENSTEPNKVRNYTAKQIKIFDTIPVWGLFYQILILYGLCYWCENVSHKIREGKDGYNDVKEFWLWVKKLLIDKLLIFTYMPFGDGDKERLKPLCNYLYSTELGKTVQATIFKNDETQQSEAKLPEELNNPNALKWLNKALDCKLLDENYQPTATVNSNGKKAALAALLNEFIGLVITKGNDYKEHYSWKPFENLWQVSNMSTYASTIINPNKDRPKYYNTYKSLLNK